MKLKTLELVIFAMLGAVMYVSKILMEFLPNIHLLGTLIVAFTVVYRKKALYPIYVFVMLTGLFNGFNTWWIPYLYIWTVLWGMVMLLPRNMPKKWQPVVYMSVSALHGLLYGVLYSPVQGIAYGLGIKGTIAWVIAGFPWDITHSISNFICGLLIIPLAMVLRKAETSIRNL